MTIEIIKQSNTTNELNVDMDIKINGVQHNISGYINYHHCIQDFKVGGTQIYDFCKENNLDYDELYECVSSKIEDKN